MTRAVNQIKVLGLPGKSSQNILVYPPNPVPVKMEVETNNKFDNVGRSIDSQVPKPKSLLGGNGSSFLVFSVVFVLLLQFYKNKGKKSKKGEVEGEDDEECLGFDDLPAVKPTIPLKIIGVIPQLYPLTESFNVAEKWSKQYGDIYTGIGLGQRFVLFNSGEYIQTLMKSADFGHIHKAPIIYYPMKPFVSNGVLVSQGAFWQKERKILLKSQNFQNLKGYIEMLNRHSGNLVKDLEKLFEDGKPHEINGLINTSFLGVISEMITGANLDRSNELTRYHHNFNIWKEAVFKRIMNPLLLLKPIWMFHPLYKNNEQAVTELMDFAKRRIKEQKEVRAAAQKQRDLEDYKPLENGNLSDSKPKFRCVLDELLDAGVDETQIIDEINTMMFGGHETGASTIHCLCFALALNPKIQQQARKEVDELFNNPNHFKNGQITYESVQINLKYVERCIMEALRLFPPVFMVARKLLTPLKIDYEGKTVKLPVGVNVVVSPYLLHRREKLYPEPEKFDPDRFLPEEAANRHAYDYVPFSAGPRNCLGLKFAMIEMKIVTAYILRHFELTTTDRMEDIPLLPFTTLTPAKDYTFEFKRRRVSENLSQARVLLQKIDKKVAN